MEIIDMGHYGWLTKENDIEEYKDIIRKNDKLQLDDFKYIKNEFINNQFEITKDIDNRPRSFVEILARAFLSGINDAAIHQITGELTKEYSPERCFCELIQNIDDCTYGEQDCPKVNIKFDKYNKTITLSYNEKGFDFADVNGICQYNETSKLIFKEKDGNYYLEINNSEETIEQNNNNKIFSYYQTGEKGIGFKAIYQITKRVRIKSGVFDFYIINEHYTGENIRKIPIPMWNYSSENNNSGNNNGTEITLYLKDEVDFEMLKDRVISGYFCGKISENNSEVNLLINNNILFTKKLREVCIDDSYTYSIQGDTLDALDIIQRPQDDNLDYWEGIYGDNGSKCSYAKQQLTGEYKTNTQPDEQLPKIEMTKFISTVVFDEDTVKARYQEKYNQSGNQGDFIARQQTRNIAFALEKKNGRINLNKEGGYYTTLPLKYKTEAPFSVDAPFILNKSRSAIYFPQNTEDENAENILKWNIETIKKVRCEYTKLLLQNRDDIEFIKYMIFEKGISSEEKEISVLNKYELKEYLKNEIWKVPDSVEIIKLTEKNEYKSIKDVYFFDNSLYYSLPKYLNLAIAIKQNVGSVNIGDKAYVEGDKSIFKENNILKEKNILKLNEVGFWNTYVADTSLNVINQNNDLSWFKTELIVAMKKSGMKYSSELKIFVHDSSLVSQNEIDGIIIWNNDKDSVGCVHTTKSVLPGIEMKKEIKDFFEASIIDNKSDKIKDAIQDYIESIDNPLKDKGGEICNKADYNDNPDTFYSKDRGEEICNGYISVLLGTTEFEIDFSELKFKYIDYFGISNENDWFSKYLWKIGWYESKNDIKSKWETMVISCCNGCKKRLPNVASRIFNSVVNDDLKTKILCALLREDNVNDNSKIQLEEKDISTIFEAINMYRKIETEKETNAESEEYKNLNELYKKIDKYFTLSSTGDNSKIEGDENSGDVKKHAVAILRELLNNEKNTIEVYSVLFNKNGDDSNNYDYVRIGNVLICDSDKFIEGIKHYIEDLGKKDKAGHFQNRLELLKMKESINKNNEDPKEFIKNLAEYRKIQCECGFDVTNLVKELQNNNGEVWPEILQNINDAREELPNKNDLVNVIIDNLKRTITLGYAEKGFDDKDIKGITDLGNGSKTDTAQTGEKGIGFKAVYRWAYKVEIHSNGFHFSIGPNEEPQDDKDIVKNCTVPQWIVNTNSNSEDDSQKTKIILYLKQGTDVETIKNAISNKDKYLCLDNIGNLELKNKNSKDPEFKWSRDDDVKKNYYYFEKKLSDCFEEEKQSCCDGFIKSRNIWEKLSDDKIETLKEKLKIQYYFVKNLSENDRNKQKCIWNYATLPLSKPSDNYPAIIINAPFATDISRKSILSCDYNKKLVKIIIKEFKNAVMDATCTEKGSNEENIHFQYKEGGILFYLNGLDENYRKKIEELELFTCYCKSDGTDSEQKIRECKKRLEDIIPISDHLIYSLLEKLDIDGFIESIKKLRSCDDANDDNDSMKENFILSVLESSNKAVLKKTDNVKYYEIDEIIKWINNLQPQQISQPNCPSAQELITKFVKGLNLPKEGYLAKDGNDFVDFVKELWNKVYKSEDWKNVDRTCPIYPFACGDKGENGNITKTTRLTALNKENETESNNELWCYDLKMEHFSTDYYKILDLDWLSKILYSEESVDRGKRAEALKPFDTVNGKEIMEYTKKIEENRLKDLLRSKTIYSDDYWKILKNIYDLGKEGM